MQILVLKTGALGDVLRTTSILPGLVRRYPGAQVTWLTAPGAVDLVRWHPLVASVRVLDLEAPDAVDRAARELGPPGRFGRVLSFDDEEPLCRLATLLVGDPLAGALSGAYLAPDGTRAYTPDVAPWFDMGLLSVHGKERADELKRENRLSHPDLYARMLGIEPGEPELPLPDAAREHGRRFAARHALRAHGPAIGLNTGAAGRWESKRLSVERTVALARELSRRRGGSATFVVLGGPAERERNAAILAELLPDVRAVDAGTDNALLDFAALIGELDLLIASDSLALHLGVSQRVPVVAFFAPTSAAEIELYGRGEKVASLAPDACSYRPDADTSTLTVERLVAAAERVLAAHAGARPVRGTTGSAGGPA